MKKFVMITIILLCIVLASVTYGYYRYTTKIAQIRQNNSTFEIYKDRITTGTDIVTVINKIIDNNNNHNVPKDEKGNFMDNGTTSILCDIYFVENEKTYKIESIYNAGIEKFSKNFSNQKFLCTTLKYHDKTKTVSYLRFEQIK